MVKIINVIKSIIKFLSFNKDKVSKKQKNNLQISKIEKLVEGVNSGEFTSKHLTQRELKNIAIINAQNLHNLNKDVLSYLEKLYDKCIRTQNLKNDEPVVKMGKAYGFEKEEKQYDEKYLTYVYDEESGIFDLYETDETDDDIEIEENFNEILKLDNIILHQKYPAYFLTKQYIDRGYYSEDNAELLLKKFLKFIRRIETKLDIKFTLLPLDSEHFQRIDNYKEELMSIPEFSEYIHNLDINEITDIISAKKINNKKRCYLNSDDKLCSTEEFVIDYFNKKGYKAMYCENNYWKAITVLCFFEEIFSNNWDGFNDIPYEMTSSYMYKEHKEIFDKKIDYIQNVPSLKEFILEQISYFGFTQVRYFKINDTNYLKYIKENACLLDNIPKDYFIQIITRLIKCLDINGCGLPDLCCYNSNEFIFIEVKRLGEQIRDCQYEMIAFLRKNKIPIKIVRVKTYS